MNKEVFGVYGASGCGRGVMPLLRAQVGKQHECIFIDDSPMAESINGHRVFSFEQFQSAQTGRPQVCVAIADPRVREHIVQRCAAAGFEFVNVLGENVIVMDDVQLGEGAILSPFVTLTSNIRVGRHFHANLYSYVEHDCTIGDFVTFAPSVRCNGNVIVEDYAYIGAGAVIKQGKPGTPLIIGKGAVVGMGAVVTKSVPPYITVVGNPARPLSRHRL